MIKRFILILFCFLILSSALYSEEALRFGLFPAYSPKTMIFMFNPVAENIEKVTGRKVILRSAPDRAAFRQRVISGEYDIIWPNNAIYIEAADKAGFRAVAAGVPGFRGVVMVHEDSPINSIEDLRGKRIVAVNPESIAGYLFFRNMMAELGYHSPEDFTVDFNEDRQSLPFLIIDKKYDALVFSEDTYISSPIYESASNKLKVIAYSIRIPQFPFAVSSGIDDVLAEEIQTAIISISNTSGGRVMLLDKLNLDEIVEKSDQDYNDFRELYLNIKAYENN